MKKPLSQRRSLIPKHRMNVRSLPLLIAVWRKRGEIEKADRGQAIYDTSVRELRALGEPIVTRRTA